MDLGPLRGNSHGVTVPSHAVLRDRESFLACLKKDKILEAFVYQAVTGGLQEADRMKLLVFLRGVNNCIKFGHLRSSLVSSKADLAARAINKPLTHKSS